MTEELMELLANLQQAYGISQEDFKAVVDAINVTIEEAVGAIAGMPEGGAGYPSEEMIAEEG